MLGGDTVYPDWKGHSSNREHGVQGVFACVTCESCEINKKGPFKCLKAAVKGLDDWEKVD